MAHSAPVTVGSASLNFQAALSVQVHDNLTQIASGNADYPCRGRTLGFQPKTFTYNVPRWREVKQVYVRFYGECDDYCDMYLNDTHVPFDPRWRMPLIRRTPSWRGRSYDGIFAFSMSSATLTVKTGAYNTQGPDCAVRNFTFEIILRN